MLFEPANLSEQKAKIVVVGVGGGGGNALNRMIFKKSKSTVGHTADLKIKGV